MNFSHLTKHIAGGKLPSTVILTGSGPSHVTMLENVLQARPERSVRHVYGNVKHVGEVLSAKPLAGVEYVFVIHDALPMLKDSDVPWIDRVLSRQAKLHTVWLGELPTATMARNALLGSSAKIYEAGFGTSDAQKKIFVSWVQSMSGLTPGLAEWLAKAVKWDEERAASLSHKVRVLGADVSPHDITTLAQDFDYTKFTEALITHNLGEAATQATTIPNRVLPRIFTELAAKVRLMGRIYPAVQKFSVSGVPATKMTKVPLPVLDTYWNVAGHYAPTDVARLLLLLASTSDQALSEDRSDGALLSLVLSW